MQDRKPIPGRRQLREGQRLDVEFNLKALVARRAHKWASRRGPWEEEPKNLGDIDDFGFDVRLLRRRLTEPVADLANGGDAKAQEEATDRVRPERRSPR